MKKTLIVLGAGASKDFCDALPTGAQLFADLERHFHGTRYAVQDSVKEQPEVIEEGKVHYLSSMLGIMRNVMHAEPPTERDLLDLENQIFKSYRTFEWWQLRGEGKQVPSVDRFVAKELMPKELRPMASKLLKFSIAYLIKGAEEAVTYRDAKGRLGSDNWIRTLCQGLRTEHFNHWRDKLMVFDFNYDRVFERYFHRYMLELGEPPIQLRDNIYHHVYGSIGTLHEVPFETQNDVVHLMRKAYPEIDLMFEERCNSLPSVQDFEVVHFLGFGYDKENLKVLNLPGKYKAVLKGTASKSITDQEKQQWDTDYGIKVFKGMRCQEYVKTYIIGSSS